MTDRPSGSAALLTGRIGRITTALGGALAALGQSPFDLWPLSLAGFAAVLSAASAGQTRAEIALRLWLGGALYFAVALHWIVEPFFVDAARHGWMAPFAILLMAGGMALFWALPGRLIARALPTAPLTRAMALALAIAIGELARAYIFSGFPWAHPGHVLIASPYLGLAALLGPHGLTLAVLLVSAGLAALILLRFGPIVAIVAIAAIWAPWLSPPAPDRAPDGAPLVRLIQPNAPQDQKWDPEMMPVFFQRGLDLTAGPGELDLIIWPETSLPELLSRATFSRQAIAEAAGGVPVIVGAQDLDEIGARNVAALLEPGGTPAWIYRKHHLVPFGEYIPLRQVAQRIGLGGIADVIGGGFFPGAGPALFDLGPELGRAYLMICYEAIFPQYIRQVDRPDWLLHLTNDAWFGSFSGPYQHLALARLRAVEQGLPVLRAANTGVSAVIDARGQIVSQLPLNSAGALDAGLPAPRPATLYAQIGDLPILAALGAALLGLLGLGRLIPVSSKSH